MEYNYGKIMQGTTEIVFWDNKKPMELKDMQKFVGGLIELLYVNEGFAKMKIDMFINEEGKFIEDMKHTAVMVKDDRILDLIMGNILFTSTDEEGNTISLNDEQILYIKKNLVGNVAGVMFKDGTRQLIALQLD